MLARCVQYGSGAVKGSVGQDTVTWGDFSVPNVEFGEVTEEADGMQVRLTGRRGRGGGVTRACAAVRTGWDLGHGLPQLRGDHAQDGV